MWKCKKCGRMAAIKMTVCRKCGTPKPEIGFIDEVKGTPRATPLKTLEAQGKVSQQKKINNKKIAALPKPEEGVYFTSAMNK